jgi:hypothetical protein
MEGADDRKWRLTVVTNGDSIAIWVQEIGFIPFEDILSALVLAQKNLGTKQPDLEFREVVSVAFENGDAACIVKNFVSEPTLLKSDESPRDPIHGKGRW